VASLLDRREASRCAAPPTVVLAYVLDEHGCYEVAGEYATPAPLPVTVLPKLAVEWSEVFDPAV
jgi:hypothetical protein